MKIDTPEDAGMSSERLGRITPIMEDFVKDNRLPGIMTLLQRRGKIVHLGKFGLMDIEAGKPIQEDTIFRIYSMTKPFTSLALMMLLEEGRCSLTEPVSTFIPAFAKTKVCVGSGVLGLKLENQQPEMTLHHLLTHTAGLSYGWFFDSPVEDLYRQAWQGPIPRDRPLQEFVERVAELPLLYQPGTQWRYSFATDVLGYVIQILSDMPLGEFFKERIFKPLGMTETGFHVPVEQVNRLAQIYNSQTLYNPRLIPPEEVFFLGNVTKPTQCPSGGGGLVSTLPDYLKFCTCLLNNGLYEGGQLISRKTLDWMTAKHVQGPLPIGDGTFDHSFGLGFRVTDDLGLSRILRSVGEFGWGGAAKTHFWVDPTEDFIGLFMTQYLPMLPYPVIDRFCNLAYQAIVD